MNKRYYSISSWLLSRFGERVYKVTLESGFSCPNRDGSFSRGGCIFCHPASYHPATAPVHGGSEKPIRAQIEEGIEYLKRRHGAARFIGYFQRGSNTHASPRAMAAVFGEAISHPDVAGLAISTRPDCIDADRIEVLSALAGKKPLWVELGLQSAHDKTLIAIRRGHSSSCFAEAARRLGEAGIPTCAHVILGLPGETPEMMKETARFINGCGIWGVKIHNLHVLKGTELSRLYEAGELSLPALEEYASWVADFLEELDPSTVVHRVSGHSPRRLTQAPTWSPNKLGIMNAVDAEMKRRESRQGLRFTSPSAEGS